MKAILTALLLFIFFFDDAACRTFTRLRMPYDANEVRCIEQDATGMIWIGSKRGVFSFDGYNLHKMRYETNIEVESMLVMLTLNRYQIMRRKCSELRENCLNLTWEHIHTTNNEHIV